MLVYASIITWHLNQDQTYLFLETHACETLFAEIQKPNKNLLIGVCYRPPGQPLHEFNGKLYE